MNEFNQDHYNQIEAMGNFAAAMIKACGLQSVVSVIIESGARVMVNFDDDGDAMFFRHDVVDNNPDVFMHVESGFDFVSFVVGDFDKMATCFVGRC